MNCFIFASIKSKSIPSFILFVVLLLLPSCNNRSDRSKSHVGPMEANRPWMIFDPTWEQDRVHPFGDLKNPDILYLGVVMGDGEAIKINLQTKETSQFRFNVKKWEDIEKYTTKYDLAYRCMRSNGPIQIEFRGKRVDQTVQHMFGDPVPNKPGSYKAEFRTGYYYLVDIGLKEPVEWLRVKLENSELDWGGLGSAYLSPNGEWFVFVLDNKPTRTFIFNRKKWIKSKFQTDRDYQTIEVIK